MHFPLEILTEVSPAESLSQDPSTPCTFFNNDSEPNDPTPTPYSHVYMFYTYNLHRYIFYYLQEEIGIDNQIDYKAYSTKRPEVFTFL